MKTPTWNDTINGRIRAIAQLNGLSTYQVAETIQKSQSYVTQRYDAKGNGSHQTSRNSPKPWDTASSNSPEKSSR